MDNKRLKQITKEISKSFDNWDVKKAISFSQDETQTRDFLIEPFFEILKYSKMDDYLHEYIADMGNKRGRRVDMAISLGQSKPIMLIECKRATISLTDNHFRQLNEYCLYTESAKIGIVTNGIIYDFYSRSNENNVILNESPFFTFDVTNFTDADIERLVLFYRPTLDLNSIVNEAEDVYFLSKFDDALFETLSNPSDDVIRIIYKKMGGKRLTENVSSQLFNLINSSSLKSVVDRITQKEIQESNTGIITTSEELRVYNIVKTILAMSSKVKDTELERISYKDFKGSFAIIVDGSSRNKICSLKIDKNLIEIDNDTFDLKGTNSVSLTEFKKELVASALKYLNE